MNRSLTAFTLAAVVGMTSFAFAQETTTEADTATDPSLDMGQPVGEETGPRVGDRYSKGEHGDWDLGCFKTNTDSDPCSLVQILSDANGNPTAEVSLFRIAGGGQAVAGMTIVVPLETSLPAQLTISVDDAPGKRYIYSYCNQIGCIAQIGLTNEDVETFKKGSKATVSLVPAQAPDQVISLDMSLKGFTAGYNVVDVVEN